MLSPGETVDNAAKAQMAGDSHLVDVLAPQVESTLGDTEFVTYTAKRSASTRQEPAFHLCDSGGFYDDGEYMLDSHPEIEETLKTLLKINEIPEAKGPSSECAEITQVCACFVYERTFLTYQ